jgi:tetratricopeptide (TPR) repeat protein
MANNSEPFEQAARLARSGEKDRARFLFMQIVAAEPENFRAWLWLSELTDDLEEQLEMLEEAVKHVPEGADGRKDLQTIINELHGSIPLPPPATPIQRNDDRTPGESHSPKINSVEVYQRAERLVLMGKRAEALNLINELIEVNPTDERTWLMRSELSPHLPEKVDALKKAVAINPENVPASARLDVFRSNLQNPMRAGKYLEDWGELDQALDLYRVIASQAASVNERNEAQHSINRLECCQKDPVSSPSRKQANRFIDFALSLFSRNL